MNRVSMPLIGLVALAVLGLGADGAQGASFEKDVAPLFAKKCAGCHSSQAKRLKASLDLSSVASVLKGSEYGEVVKPGDADGSLLVQTLEHTVEPYMPPPEKFDKLSEKEINLIRQWIDEGALAAVERPDESPTREVAEAPEPGEGKAAPVASLAFSPDGKILARGGLRRVDLLEVDPDTGEASVVATLPGHADLVRALDVSPDGKLLAAGGGKTGSAGEVLLWDIESREIVRRIEAHTDNILDVAFSPDGERLATCGYDTQVKVWEVTTGKELRSMKDHVDAVYALEYSADGGLLASGAGDRTVKIWDGETGERIMTLSDSTQGVLAVAFSPDGRHIAAGAADKMIRVWDLSKSGSESDFKQSQITTGVLVQSKFAHDAPVLSLAYSPDGKTLYSSSEDKAIKAWNPEDMTETFASDPLPDWPLVIALDPDGRFLSVGRYDSVSAIYDAETRRPLWSSNPVELELAKAQAEEEGEDEIVVKHTDKDGVRRVNVDAVITKATIPPSIGSVSPSRWARGSTVELAIDGKNLLDAEVIVSDAKISAKILSNERLPIPEYTYDSASMGVQVFDNARPHKVKLALDIPEDTALGTKFIFFKTPRGLSSAGTLEVLSRPDIAEAEPNGSFEQAKSISFPATIGGAIGSDGDLDRFRVHAEKGTEVVFALTNSEPQVRLRLYDSANRPVAPEDRGESDGRTLGYRFEEDDDVTVEVYDRNAVKGQRYRLHIGEFPYVSSVSPLGVRAGEPQTVQVTGFNLGGATELEVDPPDQAKYGTTVALPIPVYEGSPVKNPKLAVASFAEAAEAEPNDTASQAQPLEFPATANAAIEGDEADLYSFRAVKGQKIVIETFASRLGSSLDSFVEVLDSEGAPLRRATVRCVAQARMTLTGRDSRQTGLRIDDWSDLSLNDYVMVGSEILKVLKIPDYADEDTVFVSYTEGQRRGYFGTTPEHHAVGTAVYKAEIHPPGSEFPPNGMPVHDLYWRNDDGFFGNTPPGDSYLVFEAPADGEYIVRVSDTLSAENGKRPYRLHLRPLDPDYKLQIIPHRLNVNAGGRSFLEVRVRRSDGFTGPIKIEIEGLPEGIEIPSEWVLAGEDTLSLPVYAAEGAHSATRPGTIRFKGTATIDGKEIGREAKMGELIVDARKPDLVVSGDPQTLRIFPGRASSLTASVERNNGFDGRVPIEVLNLPFGVYVTDTGLNGILVRAGETTRTMQIYAEPWVEPMERDVYVKATIQTRTASRMVFVSPAIGLVTRPEVESEDAARVSKALE